jgi:molybdopterin-containing oxidoreductase family membrane subunit
MRVANYKFFGQYAPFFWGMAITNFVIPVALLASEKKRTIPRVLIASISVVIGMWLERLNIVVPSLANPRLPYDTGFYIPTWTEWSLFAGMVALFVLSFVVISKFFPLISIWEMEEGRSQVEEVTERLRDYLPPPALAPQGEN